MVAIELDGGPSRVNAIMLEPAKMLISPRLTRAFFCPQTYRSAYEGGYVAGVGRNEATAERPHVPAQDWLTSNRHKPSKANGSFRIRLVH